MRRWVAGQIEHGAWQGPLGRSLARVWMECAEPVRPVVLPRGLRVIGVGGARLGGDGKSAVTLELARRLERGGERVAVLARAYPRRLRVPCRVSPLDSAARVGDEPLMLARALASTGIAVIAGSDYRAGLEHAARLAPTVIADGLLQAAPRRLACSLLVVGRGPLAAVCPPAGDLRAGWERLLDAADLVLAEAGARMPESVASRRPALGFDTELDALSDPAGSRWPVEVLRARRFGLVLALARPERVIAELARRGLRPDAIDLYADHQPPTRTRRLRGRAAVDLWVTSAKCRTKLGERYRAAPVWTLEQRVNLPPTLIERLRTQDGSHAGGPW